MADLESVLVYLCDRAAAHHRMSNARLTKMVYLADWRMALQHGRQVTSVQWKFSHFGPFVDDVISTALASPRFEVEQTPNTVGGGLIKTVRLVREDPPPVLHKDEKAALDHVIRTTQDLSWQPFISLIYSTYPIATQPRFQNLDLIELAKIYGRQKLTLSDG